MRSLTAEAETLTAHTTQPDAPRSISAELVAQLEPVDISAITLTQ